MSEDSGGAFLCLEKIPNRDGDLLEVALRGLGSLLACPECVSVCNGVIALCPDLCESCDGRCGASFRLGDRTSVGLFEEVDALVDERTNEANSG